MWTIDVHIIFLMEILIYLFCVSIIISNKSFNIDKLETVMIVVILEYISKLADF